MVCGPWSLGLGPWSVRSPGSLRRLGLRMREALTQPLHQVDDFGRRGFFAGSSATFLPFALPWMIFIRFSRY